MAVRPPDPRQTIAEHKEAINRALVSLDAVLLATPAAKDETFRGAVQGVRVAAELLLKDLGLLEEQASFDARFPSKS